MISYYYDADCDVSLPAEQSFPYVNPGFCKLERSSVTMIVDAVEFKCEFIEICSTRQFCMRPVGVIGLQHSVRILLPKDDL